MSNKILLEDQYIFQWKLGHGTFGEVWKVLDKSTNTEVAFKIEEKDNDKSMLRDEYKIYYNMKKNGLTEGVPKIYRYLSTTKYNIMVMELLDKSLEKIFNDNNKQFGLGTVLLLGINMVNLLEKVHKAGYIHRDIKPNNFMFKTIKGEPIMYIMDFGLAKKYISSGVHIPMRTGRSLIGTARYASINIHMGFEPSRRDDLISVGYMLIYFYKGKLPWQGLQKKSGIDHLENIGNKKLGFTIEKLCKNIPECFKEYLKYCQTLQFDEIPDYDYIKKILTNAADKHKVELKYEWINKT